MPHDATTELIDRPSRLSPALVIWCAVLIVIGFSLICGGILLGMRRGYEDLARQTAENLAVSIDADVSRNIELYDLSLVAVVNNVKIPEVMEASASLKRLILFDHSTTAQHFGAIQILDEIGNVVMDSQTTTHSTQNAFDEEFFQVHRKDPIFGLYISRPMARNGAYGVVLSRRLSGRDGTFRGIVTGFLRFTYFHELTGRLNIGPDDTITLFRQDGVVIMRRPFDMDVIGKDMGHAPAVQKVLASLNGSFIGKGSVDDVDRLYVWRDTSHPLIALVGLSLDGIYGRWRREALQIVAASAILGLLTLFGAVSLARQMKRRFAAEQKLNHLAMTDGLTGLANRRHFDEILNKEWSRATREKTCVALLMIDADHFKSYNDLFGHQAGDDVLTNIASCIASVPKRGTDCCARYGGEEFAVVLPGLSLSEAARLGEQIRLQVLLQPSEPRAVTVSVGVASAFPVLGQSAKDLIRTADAALYRAKEQGRNRTFAHEIGQARLVA